MNTGLGPLLRRSAALLHDARGPPAGRSPSRSSPACAARARPARALRAPARVARRRRRPGASSAPRVALPAVAPPPDDRPRRARGRRPRRCRRADVAGLAVVLGLLHGVWNGTELRGSEPARFGNALGRRRGDLRRRRPRGGARRPRCASPWARIAVRVAGSWIAAAGLLMLGWSLRAA